MTDDVVARIERLEKFVQDHRADHNKLVSLITKETAEMIAATQDAREQKKASEDRTARLQRVDAAVQQMRIEIKEVREFLEKSLSQDKREGEPPTPPDRDDGKSPDASH
jgi:septal ring factor EnvC (AmiA/AmiB activator)